MAQVHVLQKSYIGNRIAEAGEVVDYVGPISENLEPVLKEKAATSPNAKARDGLSG